MRGFYESLGVPEQDRIKPGKNILFVLPSRDFDLSAALKRTGLSYWEVALTWPKPGVDVAVEASLYGAGLVLQIGNKQTKRLPHIDEMNNLGDWVNDAMNDRFVALHHHDEYSIKDGLGTAAQLAVLLRKQRRTFLCVTNHGSIGGWIKQHRVCKEYGLKSIYGCELYTSPYRGDDLEERKKYRSANHLIVLARTNEGFHNIIRIHNDAQLNGFYYTPRANMEAFKKWGKGIVATSACSMGEVPSLLMAGEEDEAKRLCEFFKGCFDEFYIELSMIECEEQKEVNRRLIRLAVGMGLPMVVSVDSHYLEPEHSSTHDVLMCIRQRRTVFDAKEKDDVWTFDVKNLYYRDFLQVWDLFLYGFVDAEGVKHAGYEDDVFTADIMKEALANTRKIAIEAEEIELDASIKLPRLYADANDVLMKKANVGMAARGLDRAKNAAEYQKRLAHEHAVITKLGWADYFLIIERIVADAKAKFGEWALSWGRGSGAGSLISYLLGLTDVDPVLYKLSFSRFIDESRSDPPDLDLDFNPRIRDWVKQHIVEMFGQDKVCSIGSYQTYKTRAVILDVARALGKDVNEANEVTKKMDPLRAFETEGEEQTIDKMSFDEVCKYFPDLQAYFEQNPDVRHHAEVLRNQVKNMSMHAGGVIISDKPLGEMIPLLWDKAGNEDRKVMSAWTESGATQELSVVGLVKYDILASSSLEVIEDCIAEIERSCGVRLERKDIPIDDREAISKESKGEMVGIFQFENPTMWPTIHAIKMSSLEDAAIVSALLRPGPKDMGMDMEYALRKSGSSFVAPALILKMFERSRGILIFQEDIMRLAKELAGFSDSDANKLRKAASKKNPVLMASFREKFIAGARPRVERGEITAAEVEQAWELIARFAEYAFCAAHAVSYGAVSCAEMWLKHNYPTEFICALMNNAKLGKKKHDSDDLLADYIKYAIKRGIEVLPPDVNESDVGFRVQGGKIRFSLSHVKNVASMAEVIVSNRPYASVEDFFRRARAEAPKKTEDDFVLEGDVSGEARPGKSRQMNSKVIESLIYAGAFDRFGTRHDVRRQYFALRKDKKVPELLPGTWEDSEKEMIGLCLSQPSLAVKYADVVKSKGWRFIGEADDEANPEVFGRVEDVKHTFSKAGNEMLVVELGDGLDNIRFFVFKSAIDSFRERYSKGTVCMVPLSHFKDGGGKFYDSRRTGEVVFK